MNIGKYGATDATYSSSLSRCSNPPRNPQKPPHKECAGGNPENLRNSEKVENTVTKAQGQRARKHKGVGPKGWYPRHTMNAGDGAIIRSEASSLRSHSPPTVRAN